jgi:hypothetical protein
MGKIIFISFVGWGRNPTVNLIKFLKGVDYEKMPFLC